MTYLVALAFLAILSSLAVALFFMMRGGKPQDTTQPSQRTGPRAGAAGGVFHCAVRVHFGFWQLGWTQPQAGHCRHVSGPRRAPAQHRRTKGTARGAFHCGRRLRLTASTPGCTSPARPRPRSASTRLRPRNRSGARREVALLQAQGDEQQHQHAHKHVEAVEAGQHEEGRTVNAGAELEVQVARRRGSTHSPAPTGRSTPSSTVSHMKAMVRLRLPASSAWWAIVRVTPEVSSNAVLMVGSGQGPHGRERLHDAGAAKRWRRRQRWARPP